jgi:hypothetical protein
MPGGAAVSPDLLALTALLRRLFPGMDTEDDAPIPPPADWRRWAALVESNRLAPLIGNRLAGGLRIDGIPDALAVELAASAAEETREAAVRELALSELRRTLADAGLAWAELKGAALVDDLYAARCERAMGDVDLLLESPEACAAAADLLRGGGFRIARDMPGHHHLAPMRDHSTLLAVELHHNLTAPPLPPEALALFWARRIATPGGFRLDDSARLLHHVLHAANDPVDGPLLRDLFECGAQACALSEEQWEDFVDLTERTGRRVVASEVLALAAELTGCPRLDAVRPSAMTFWMRRRLEWCGAPSAAGRLVRQCARRHLERSQAAGRLRPAWLGLPGALLDLRGRPTPSGARPRASDFPFVRIGTATLVHRPDTGEVHLLGEPAATVWHALRDSPAGGQINASTNLPPPEFRAALQALRAAGLGPEPEDG